MESKKINQLATELAPELSDLTIIGDPATGISKKITLSQMASLFTGTVEEYASLSAFPLVGAADTIYIALDTNIIYRWNTGTSAYVELSPNIVTSLVFNDANGFDGTISLVGSTATLTITTALTTGSVGFIGASGALLQDNANFFWDNSNKRLGINTNTPTTALDVFGSGIIGRINGTSTNNAFLGFASAGTNKWSIGNVQSDHRFRIYSEANTAELVSVLQTGEVGIGIANPLTKLHIFGGASALIANLDANTSVAKSISFRSGNSSRINLEVSGTESGSNAGADLFIRRYSDAGALLDTAFSIKRSNGNIGIGISNSNVTRLLVQGIDTTSSNYAIAATDSSASNLFWVRNDGIAYFSNNVGIGTNTPAARLDVKKDDGVSNGLHIIADFNRNSSTSAQILFGYHADGTNVTNASIYSANSQPLRFYTGAQMRMTIEANGYIGVGTANPTLPLFVYGNGSANSIMTEPVATFGKSNGINIGSDGTNGLIGVQNSGTSMVFLKRNAGVYEQAVRITSDGLVYIGSSTFTDANGGLALKGSGGSPYISWHSDSGTRLGYIQMQTSGITTFSSVRNVNFDGGYVRINGFITGYDGSSANLQVNGFARIGGQLILHNSTTPSQEVTITCNGSASLNVAGAFSASSKSFLISHPLESLESTHNLRYVSVEAPQADLYYRGKLKLVNGKGQANINEVATMTEGTFEALCREIQCFTTNETGWDLVKGKVIGNIIYIESQNQNSTDEISWLVIGERKDKHMIDTDWTDENGKVIVEPLKEIKEDNTIQVY